MNFLAHLYLAGNKPECIIGNFIADHVKGHSIELYSEGIKQGIRFHRSVDHFTDINPVVVETVKLLRPHFRKYSGVVLDMYYDHFLAANWSTWSSESLDSFTARMFKTLNASFAQLPPRSQYILPVMVQGNWLLNYRNFEGLHSALSGISQRTSFYSNLEYAVEHLKLHYNTYQESFQSFFPELIEFSKVQKQIIH